jgi:hypothetical protein
VAALCEALKPKLYVLFFILSPWHMGPTEIKTKIMKLLTAFEVLTAVTIKNVVS